MKKVGIAIDAWKLSIFDRHLKQAGYTYERRSGLTEDTFMLYVRTGNVEALGEVCRAADTEAAHTGSQVQS